MTTGLTTTEPKGLTLHTVDDAMKFGKMLADSEFRQDVRYAGQCVSAELLCNLGGMTRRENEMFAEYRYSNSLENTRR